VHHFHRAGARRRQRRRFSGLTVLEVTIAFTVVATILLAAAGSFSSSITAVKSAERRSRGSVFLETVMQDLSAQPYDNLLAFDGDHLIDGATAAQSSYAVDLTVFVAAVDLVEIQAVLRDQNAAREVCRVTTLRSRR
jgi:Tfp pilus assembly protein PilV